MANYNMPLIKPRKKPLLAKPSAIPTPVLPRPKNFKRRPLEATRQGGKTVIPSILFKAEIATHISTNPRFKLMHMKNPKLIDSYIMGQIPLEEIYNRKIFQKPVDLAILNRIKRSIEKKVTPDLN